MLVNIAVFVRENLQLFKTDNPNNDFSRPNFNSESFQIFAIL